MFIEHPFEGLSHNIVKGTGRQPNRLLFIGESPGHEEDEKGICFVGKTGREFDNFYLNRAALRRHEVRVNNLIPVHPFANRNPTTDEIHFFESLLLREIEETDPEFIIPMGAFATKYFLGWQADLHTVHGLPHHTKKFPNITILPSYHPAAGLHNTESQALIVYDFEQIQHALQGTLPDRPLDEFPNPIYEELFTRQDVFQSLNGVERLLMGSDTEGYKFHPWGLSYAVDMGVSYVIRIQSTEALRAFAEWITAHPETVVILHNALHDLPIYRDMGIEIKNFEDTMVYSYVLCLEPQGLKDLAYRHCGMKMKSYDETIAPAMRKVVGEYLIQVARGDWGLDPQVPECESAEEIKFRQPTALHKRALRAVSDIYGKYTGYIVGPKRGGSAQLAELGFTVNEVNHEVADTLPKLAVTTGKKVIKTKYVQTQNAWNIEVPIPLLDRLDPLFGEFVWKLQDPVPPVDPPDPVKRWKAMQDDLEESVERCESAIGTPPIVGLDALEDQQVAVNYSCLDNGSVVLTEDGTAKLGDLVRQRYSGLVWSFDDKTASKVLRKVVGWYRQSERSYIDWWSLETLHGQYHGRGRMQGGRYTSDHRVLTGRGFVRVSELTKQDTLALPVRRLRHHEKSLIIGSMLGDGTISRRNRGNGWAALRTSHCAKQRSYLNWKYGLLTDLSTSTETCVDARIVKIGNRYANRTAQYQRSTVQHPELLEIWKQVYCNGLSAGKRVGKWADALDAFGLSIWYQDDGTLINGFNVRLYTLSFTEEEVEYLREILISNFGIHSTQYKPLQHKNQWALHITSDKNTSKFFAAIAPFVHPTMQYKLPEKFRGQFKSPEISGEWMPFMSPVVDVYRNPQRPSRRGSFKTKYCIDVDGTHNFFTQGEIAHNCRDAHATLMIRDKLRGKVEANGLLDLAMLDMSVLPYIDRMKTAGIAVNQKHMLDYGEQLKVEMRELQEKLKKDLGFWLNPSSSKQVAMVIYDVLGFPVEVRTKNGDPSTNDKVLEALSPLHPNINDITTFRELHKLRSTYALKLPRWMDESGRLHPTWKTTRVPSGRLAAADPNLMAIPIRTQRGNMIRKGFVPRPGCCFIGVDLSQIEMRVLAHLSRDINLIALFNEGRDFHSATAAYMWNMSLEEIDADYKALGGASKRASGKNVSFGIVYGVTARGLQAQVKSKTHEDWSEEKCQQMIDLWLNDAYPGVKVYMENQKSIARQKGYVETLMGRRRYVPGVHSSIPRIREEAGRQAINHPVQGSAAEVIKKAMRNLWNKALPTLWEAGIYCEPVLQIHDELVLEVQADAAQEVAVIVKWDMENALDLCVPINADFHITKTAEEGGSWADLK